ncbi:alkaline phosphatase family protein [Archaeoglobus veneficus]|uniref:Type I phosphodiesterase/nucleotide pyrophosphatase n=1 Tax=Archaeoglobus veneficus (strain DSM 11195 / SNP6) TaxID=693661 RepID=F2KQE4_ARCVS|nr:alkaline phosphatase family protein [Archaeoglobus veneficus]AEA46577.1 type I phosphodiesterase/nucleotide pyrophosphatase [Archaeoglobus veneficus SNP6]
MSKNKRVIVIGLDGATWDLIKPWADEGELPTFKKLMEDGVWGYLESTIPPITGPAWVSFSTGKNPGKHGIFDFVYFENGRLKLHTSEDIKCKTIYEILSKKGLRSVIIGLPLSFPPPEGFNGIMVSDFLYPHKEIFPSNKLEYIKDYKVVPDLSKRGVKLIEDMVETAKKQIQAAKKMLIDEKWDFYFYLYPLTDSISHHFWKELKGNTKIGQTARKIFQIADEFLSWLLDQIDENTILILMSDHGFGDYSYKINLNIIFKKYGFLKTKIVENPSEIDETLGEHVMNNLLHKKVRILSIPKVLFKLATLPLIKPIAKAIFGFIFRQNRVQINPEKIDFNNSIAFIPTSESLGIYVRDENSRKKQEITNKIMSILNELEFNKQKVFKKILRKNEVYSGPFVESAPEILLIPNGFFVSPALRGNIFEKFEPCSFHDIYGIFLVYGPGIKKGYKIENAKIYDIAPTILHILGLPIPNDMDGRVLMEIFEPNSELAKRQPVHVDPSYYDKKSEEDRLKLKIKELKFKRKI